MQNRSCFGHIRISLIDRLREEIRQRVGVTRDIHRLTRSNGSIITIATTTAMTRDINIALTPLQWLLIWVEVMSVFQLKLIHGIVERNLVCLDMYTVGILVVGPNSKR